MNSGVYKRFFSGLVELLIILFILGMVQEARAGPILKINTPKGEIEIDTELKQPDPELNPQLFETVEVMSAGPHKASVLENEDVATTENVNLDTDSHVLFTYNSDSKALTYSQLSSSVPEPSTMILFGSLLLIGLVGVKEGKKPN